MGAATRHPTTWHSKWPHRDDGVAHAGTTLMTRRLSLSSPKVRAKDLQGHHCPVAKLCHSHATDSLEGGVLVHSTSFWRCRSVGRPLPHGPATGFLN